MALPFGLSLLPDSNGTRQGPVIIAVHGFASEGGEWVDPIATLVRIPGPLYFWRWDWTACPEEASERLAAAVNRLIEETPDEERIILIGHSYGGIAVTLAAPRIMSEAPVEIHTIASPLAGHPRLAARCPDDFVRLAERYAAFPSTVHHFQWRTQKDQDNAFKDLPDDPQVATIPRGEVVALPDSADGERIGHNRSVAWVARQIAERWTVPEKN